MRVASYIGFFVMLGVGINAFARGSVWLTVLQLLVALAIGWYSLGLYARASTRAAHRYMHGVASESDLDLLGELDGKSQGEAFRAARYGADPQRDRIYRDIVGQLGGEDAAVQMIQEHAELNDCEVDNETAVGILEGWRFKGIVIDVSLGEYLDAVWAEIHAQSAES